MKYVLRRVMIVTVLALVTGVTKSYEAAQDFYQELSEQAPFQSSGRSYHGAVYDTVTGVEHSPFMFTTSSLGQSLRATAFLFSHVHAASKDVSVREQLVENIKGFRKKILKLYVLCSEALCFVERQLDGGSEKSGYLLEEVEHLHQRILELSEYFAGVVDEAQSHEISTVLVTLDTIVEETGQMLAL